MNRILNLGILLTLIFSAFGAQANHDYQHDRCSDLKAAWGEDSIPNLDGQAALRVRKWTFRCYPKFRMELLESRKVSYVNKDGSVSSRNLYPVFGTMNIVPDSQDGGIRFVSANPVGYKVSPAVIANPDAAACDLPDSYRILVFCPASL